MTISEAFRAGFHKLCKAHWLDPDDRLELYVSDGRYSPWAKLVSPAAPRALQEQQILVLEDIDDDWIEWPREVLPTQRHDLATGRRVFR